MAKENFFVKTIKNIGKFFKSLFVSVDENEPRLRTLYEKDGTKSVISALICILAGILVGVIVLVLVAIFSKDVQIKDVWKGLFIVFAGPFYTGSSSVISFGFSGKTLGDMMLRATPLVMTGLSVAVAFKTGLFNIGASGQYLMGTTGSIIVALSIPANNSVEAFFVWLLALIVGTLCGMLWGAIPGLFKALLGVNEVIVCIMTNWIAANVVSWIFNGSQYINSPAGKTGYTIPTSDYGIQTPRLLMDKLFPESWADGGIIIAILIAVAISIMLNKTTFGYELKACGHNRNAAKYAGMNDKRNIVLSMMIAGGLSACGASLYYLNGKTEFFWNTYMSLPSEGFNGIPVALLASSNPIGTIFAAIYMAFLTVAGNKLSSFTRYNEFIASIIVAVIIYFAGFGKLIKELLSKRQAERMEKRLLANAQSEVKAKEE